MPFVGTVDNREQGFFSRLFGGGDTSNNDFGSLTSYGVDPSLLGPSGTKYYDQANGFGGNSYTPFMQSTNPYDSTSNWLADMQNQQIQSMSQDWGAQYLTGNQPHFTGGMPQHPATRMANREDEQSIASKLIWGTVGVAGTLGTIEIFIRGLGRKPIDHDFEVDSNRNKIIDTDQSQTKNQNLKNRNTKSKMAKLKQTRRENPKAKAGKILYGNKNAKTNIVYKKANWLTRTGRKIHRAFYSIGNIGAKEKGINGKGNYLRQGTTGIHNKTEKWGEKIYNLFVHGGSNKNKSSWITKALRWTKNGLKRAPGIGKVLGLAINLGSIFKGSLGTGIKKLAGLAVNFMLGAATKYGTALFLAIGALFTTGKITAQETGLISKDVEQPQNGYNPYFDPNSMVMPRDNTMINQQLMLGQPSLSAIPQY